MKEVSEDELFDMLVRISEESDAQERKEWKEFYENSTLGTIVHVGGVEVRIFEEGGIYPFQAFGVVAGIPFYYRERGESVTSSLWTDNCDIPYSQTPLGTTIYTRRAQGEMWCEEVVATWSEYISQNRQV